MLVRFPTTQKQIGRSSKRKASANERFSKRWAAQHSTAPGGMARGWWTVRREAAVFCES